MCLCVCVTDTEKVCHSNSCNRGKTCVGMTATAVPVIELNCSVLARVSKGKNKEANKRINKKKIKKNHTT